MNKGMRILGIILIVVSFLLGIAVPPAGGAGIVLGIVLIMRSNKKLADKINSSLEKNIEKSKQQEEMYKQKRVEAEQKAEEFKQKLTEAKTQYTITKKDEDLEEAKRKDEEQKNDTSILKANCFELQAKTNPVVKTKSSSENDIVEPIVDIWNKIPDDVKELLFYTNEPPRTENHSGMMTITLSFNSVKYNDHTPYDPSTIYFRIPIKVPDDISIVSKLPYMPSYIGINPEQRYIYLTWLQDISRDIDVGYKFLFYYGLERMLVLGKFEKAFEMIVWLRKNTKNGSFLNYSSNALFYTVIKTGREELLDKLRFFFDDDIWSDKQIMIKLFTNEPIEPNEIPKILKRLDVNKRYLDEKVYIDQMAQLLSEKYGYSYLLPQELIDEDNYVEKDVCVFANFSMPENIRMAKKIAYPIIDTFTSTIIDLHNICHERTKKRLAEIKKKKIVGNNNKDNVKKGYALVKGEIKHEKSIVNKVLDMEIPKTKKVASEENINQVIPVQRSYVYRKIYT